MAKDAHAAAACKVQAAGLPVLELQKHFELICAGILVPPIHHISTRAFTQWVRAVIVRALLFCKSCVPDWGMADIAKRQPSCQIQCVHERNISSTSLLERSAGTCRVNV